MTPCRFGSAKTSISRSAASGSSARTRSTVTQCAQPLRPLGAPLARADPEAEVGVTALVAGAGVHEGAQRHPPGDRLVGGRPGSSGGTAGSGLVCDSGCSATGGSGDHLGAAVGQVHGVLDDVAVDVRRPVDAVRRRRRRVARSA